MVRLAARTGNVARAARQPAVAQCATLACGNTPNVCVLEFLVIINRQASESEKRAADASPWHVAPAQVAVTVGPRDVDDDENHQVRRR